MERGTINLRDFLFRYKCEVGGLPVVWFFIPSLIFDINLEYFVKDSK